MLKIMEVNYNKLLEYFEINLSGNRLFVPVRKINYMIKELENGNGLISGYLKELSAIFIPKNDNGLLPVLNDSESLELSKMIKDQFKLNRSRDCRLIDEQFYSSPQKPFLQKGTDIINRQLVEKWGSLGDFINIQQIDIVSPREDYECPREFIELKDEFLPAFVIGLNEAVFIAENNSKKINLFLMREQRHTFLLVFCGNNLFMFDSCGQRYGKTKKSLGVKDHRDDYLHLNEISYTAMFEQYLHSHPEKKLFFNLNGIQQDTTNCYTFVTDFIDGLCGRVLSFEGKDKLEQLNAYLIRFFPVQLSEQPQIFHEGAIDVLESAIFAENLDKQFKEVKRQILPSEILRSCQLSSMVTDRARTISDVPFTDISNFEDGKRTTLELSLQSTTKLTPILLKNGKVEEKTVNRRIALLREKQEILIENNRLC